MSGVTAMMLAAALSGAAPDLVRPNPAKIEAAIAEGRVPLVERQADGTFRVTFVWRGRDTTSVELDWPVWTPDRQTNRLDRIAGADLWAKTVVLPAETRLAYRLVPDVGVSPRDDRAAYRKAFAANARPDPLNPRQWNAGGGADVMSVLELPGAPAQRWTEPQADVARGVVEMHRLTSAILGNSRDVAIYRPPGLNSPRQLLIVFDGDRYRREVPLPIILDNMIAAGSIPPTAAVFVSNPSSEARGSELACNPAFSRFLVEELLPWIGGHMPTPEDPRDRILAGASFGGLASACAALDYPQAFGAVLSQSGSYWWRPESGKSPREADSDAPNWVARQITVRNPVPVRFYVEAGQLETQADNEGIRDTSRTLRDVLAQRGYEATYAEPAGGHDWYSWRGTIAQGLTWLSQEKDDDAPTLSWAR
jgi:enterochelin esterase family protein